MIKTNTTWKRMIAVLLALAMILSVAACSGGTQTPSSSGASSTSNASGGAASEAQKEEGESSGEEPELIEVTGMITEGTTTTGDVNDLPVWDFAEEATGVHVNWEQIPRVSSAEQINLRFATNDLPDLIFKCSVDSSDITQAANEGVIVPLETYMTDPAVAPNFSAFLEEYSFAEKQIRSADGHIYGFPYLVTADPSNISPKLFINKKWMEEQSLSVPTTTDELYEVLTTMKGYDYNKNGDEDETPLMVESYNRVKQGLLGSFGLGTRGSMNLNWDIDPETNALRFIPTDERYKAYLEYVNKLYTEKLLDQEVFSTDMTRLSAQAEQNTLGVVFCHNTSYLGTYSEDFIGFDGALTGPYGDNLFCGVISPVNGVNTWITSSNQHVADTVRYIDYFYSEEGVLHFFMGVEGETYEIDADGLPQFTDYVTNNPDGLTNEDVLGKYTIWGGGGNPSIADNIHFGNHLVGATTVQAASALRKTAPTDIWGTFMYSAEDAEQVMIYQTDIDTYCNDMTAKFITGEAGFDQWDSYIATVEQMDLEGYKALMQRTIDNYNKD